MEIGIVYVMQVSDRSPYVLDKAGEPPRNVLEFKYPTDRAMLKAAKDAVSRGMYVTMRYDHIKINEHKKGDVYSDRDYHNWSDSINR